MVFFKPLIISSVTQDPFNKSKIYQLKKTKPDYIYNGSHFEKMTYKKTHGVCWKIANVGFLIFACLMVYPLIKDRSCLKKIWKRIKTGEEIKIVLVSQKQLIKEPVHLTEKKIVNEKQTISTKQNAQILKNIPIAEKAVKVATLENKNDRQVELLEVPQNEDKKKEIFPEVIQDDEVKTLLKSCLKKNHKKGERKAVHFDQYADFPDQTPYKLIYDQIDIDIPDDLDDSDDEEEQEEVEKGVLPAPQVNVEQSIVKQDQVKVELKIEPQKDSVKNQANQPKAKTEQKLENAVKLESKSEKDKTISSKEKKSQKNPIQKARSFFGNLLSSNKNKKTNK